MATTKSTKSLIRKHKAPCNDTPSNFIDDLCRHYDENSELTKLLDVDWNESLPSIESLDQYDYSEECRKILELDRIDHNILYEMNLMDIINSNSLVPSDVINKQAILSALLYRQSQIDDNDPIFDNAILSFVKRDDLEGRIDTHEFEANVILKVESHDTVNAKPFIQIKIGTELIIVEKVCKEEIGHVLVRNACVLSLESDTELIIKYHVVEMSEEDIDVALVNLENIRNKSVVVYEVRDSFIHKSILRAINIMSSGCFDFVIRPILESRIPQHKDDFSLLLERIQSAYSIDFDQTKAIYNICTRSHLDSPYVITGLYGNCQLQLITIIVELLVEMNIDFRILLLSPNDWGVDQLADSLIKRSEKGLLNDDTVLRFRSYSNELKKYRVVIATLCASSYLIDNGVERGFYSHIFIYEASLTDDGNLWVPISGLANHNTSIIMTGDPLELNPIIKLNIPLKITKKFKSTLLRYSDIYESVAENSHLICQLKSSDKIQDSILKMIGNVFFDHPKLFNGIFPNPNEKLFPLMPNKKFPAIFVNLDGEECQSHGSTSFNNNEQASAVIAYVKELLELGINTDEIGIVSGYRDQTILIEQLLKNERIPNYNTINIGGVEQFQGAYKSVIVFTTVRTEHLGSMSCQLRLYTAITRAKDLLIIIGSEKTLNGDKMRSHRWDRMVDSDYKYWTQLIDYCRNMNSFIDWNGTVSLFNYTKINVSNSEKKAQLNDLTNNDSNDEILLTDDEMPNDNQKLFDDDEISVIELDDDESLPTHQCPEINRGVKRKASTSSEKY